MVEVSVMRLLDTADSASPALNVNVFVMKSVTENWNFVDNPGCTKNAKKSRNLQIFQINLGCHQSRLFSFK